MFVFAIPFVFSVVLILIILLLGFSLIFLISGLFSFFKYKIFIREGIKCTKVIYISNFILSFLLFLLSLYYIIIIMGFSFELVS